MRIDLPSGAWAELLDKYKGSLAGKVRGCIMIEVTNGRTLVPGDLGTRQADAFLRETITDWSLAAEGVPIPRTPGPNGADRTDVIGDSLDSDDYAALHEQVQPLVLRVLGRPNPPAAPALPAS
jgi:hypothetical protein